MERKEKESKCTLLLFPDDVMSETRKKKREQEPTESSETIITSNSRIKEWREDRKNNYRGGKKSLCFDRNLSWLWCHSWHHINIIIRMTSPVDEDDLFLVLNSLLPNLFPLAYYLLISFCLLTIIKVWEKRYTVMTSKEIILFLPWFPVIIIFILLIFPLSRLYMCLSSPFPSVSAILTIWPFDPHPMTQMISLSSLSCWFVALNTDTLPRLLSKIALIFL